ncbi:MAG: hypothetical protein IKQ46_09925 [Bacteroidales bacterium]|nr:hypothetical protein [Bacteroidales bacterium]
MPVKISKHKFDYADAFYINSSGELSLIFNLKEGMVYDADNNIFEGEKIITHRAFFLPVPGNDDLVYLFCDECTAMVDIKRKTVTKVDLNSWKFDNISFYHANCHDIWLFMNNSKYLITKSEVKYCGKTDIRAISPNAELYLKTEFQQIDINNYWYDLYVGSFDRKTLKTSNEYSYKLKGYSRIYNHAFSLDNTKLFLLATNNNKMDLLQIDVKNGILDIEHYKTFCLSTKKLSVISTCFMSFGLDNKLYVYVPVLKKMVRVSFDKNGNSVFVDNFLQFSRKYYGHNLLAELIRLSCKKIISQIHFTQRG